jgi:hypothetical protein
VVVLVVEQEMEEQLELHLHLVKALLVEKIILTEVTQAVAVAAEVLALSAEMEVLQALEVA